jgi:hypothetical protein
MLTGSLLLRITAATALLTIGLACRSGGSPTATESSGTSASETPAHETVDPETGASITPTRDTDAAETNGPGTGTVTREGILWVSFDTDCEATHACSQRSSVDYS